HLISLSLVPPMAYSLHVLGPYRIANVELSNIGAYTNTAPTGPYRGSGRPVGVYVIERVMDEAARVLGLDAIEIRRRNFIPPDAFPFRTAFGVAYDSGNYGRALDRAVELADYERLRSEHAERRRRGGIVGLRVRRHPRTPPAQPPARPHAACAPSAATRRPSGAGRPHDDLPDHP